MHRFFATIKNQRVILSETDAFHLLSVLRVENGEHIEVVYDSCLYECVVNKTYPLDIEVIKKVDSVHEFPLDITLFLCLTKKDKPDIVIDNATEMGVNEIVLVQSKRSVVKLDEEQLIKRIMRYKRIAKSAAMQSKRNDIPDINFLPYKSIFAYKDFDYIFIGDANDKADKVNKEFPKFKKNDRIAVIVGPEGGFDKTELDLAIKNKVIPINFSSFVLRSEVAAISILAIINYLGNLL